MIIQKQYKFYAAHRNETLQDKCSNLHGHVIVIVEFIKVGVWVQRIVGRKEEISETVIAEEQLRCPRIR